MYGFPVGADEVETWQPRLWQLGEVATTNDSFGLFRTDGMWCWVSANIGVNGAGTGNNPLLIGNPPLPILPKINNVQNNALRATALGNFIYHDSGNTFYSGTVTANWDTAADPVRGVSALVFHMGGNNNDFLGDVTNFAVAANDSLGFTLCYPFPYADRHRRTQA